MKTFVWPLALLFLSENGKLFCEAFQFRTPPQSSRHQCSVKTSTLSLVSSRATAAAGRPKSTTAVRALGEVLTAVDTFYQTAPYAAGALTCGFKASAADFVAQRREWTKQHADVNETRESSSSTNRFAIARNMAFLIYGAIYQGLAQEFIYNHCYATWFGNSNELLVVLKKVCFDIFIQTTIVTLPMAYLTKAVIFGYPLREGLRRYRDDILHQGLLKKYFLLWGPVQCLTFGVVPEHLRISFIAAVSFFWLIILSTISARGDAASSSSSAATKAATLLAWKKDLRRKAEEEKKESTMTREVKETSGNLS